MAKRKKPTRKKSGWNAPHSNSLLAQTADDAEMRRKYNEWHDDVLADEAAMRRWANNDFEAKPGSEIRSARRKRDDG